MIRLVKAFKLYCASKDMTFADVAKQINISPSTMTRIGQGKNVESVNLLALLRWLLEEEEE